METVSWLSTCKSGGLPVSQGTVMVTRRKPTWLRVIYASVDVLVSPAVTQGLHLSENALRKGTKSGSRIAAFSCDVLAKVLHAA